MNSLENANVFCINPNGVSEGYHFLTLVTCRPSLINNGNGQDKIKQQRLRTNSLPPSLEVYYESNNEDKGFKSGKRQVFSLGPTKAATVSRSLSSEDFLRLPYHQRNTSLIRDACQKCISGLTRSFDFGSKRRKSSRSKKANLQRIKVVGKAEKEVKGSQWSKSRIQNNIGTVARPKMHKSIVGGHQKFDYGFQCSGTALQLDGYMLSYFISEIKRSQTFRSSFIRRWSTSGSVIGPASKKNQTNMLVFVALMKSPDSEVLDLLGNKMVNSNILYRRSLEHALSWLSTLGGAFSALGDLSPTWAEEAAHVSLTQLFIAMKLGDPGIQSRCRLYAAISLLQRGYLKSCRDIVKKEYDYVTSLPGGTDPRLRRMCLGIWAKLQYHWELVPPADRKRLKSTQEGLNDIQSNSKYRSVYNLEENRKIVSVSYVEECS